MGIDPWDADSRPKEFQTNEWSRTKSHGDWKTAGTELDGLDGLQPMRSLNDAKAAWAKAHPTNDAFCGLS
jgi:hypothetical protein